MADRTLSVAITRAVPTHLDVTFRCAPGDVLGIYGPSGSGKTTILRTIAGLERPLSGHIAAGADVWLDTAAGISRAPHLRAAGLVFQEYALFPHLSALDNVRIAMGHQPRSMRTRLARQLLDQVELGGRIHQRPAELSGGEKQRVALARALARDPAVLLLDEPFSAVDRPTRRRLQNLVDKVRRPLEGPVVLVTHDFEDIVRLASHLLVLDEGRVTASGTVRDVTSRTDATWLGDAVGVGSVFDGTVTGIDTQRGLATLAFDGGTLLAPDTALAAGQRVRVRIPARDVILATDVPAGLSLHNALAATVASIAADERSRHVVVQLAVGHESILAEVTRDAITRLDIRPGRELHGLIKSVSLQVLPLD